MGAQLPPFGPTTKVRLVDGSASKLADILARGQRGKQQIVATRGRLPGTVVSGTYTQTEARAACKFGPSACSDIQIAMPGFYIDNVAQTEVALPNDVTVEVGLEKLSPNIARKGSIAGRTSMSIQGGSGISLSEPIGLDFAAGEIAKYQYAQRVANATDSRLATPNFSGLADAYRSTQATSNVGVAGAWDATGRTTNPNVATPTAIIGRPAKPFRCIIGVGDSIMTNTGDIIGDAYGNHGFLERASYDGGPNGDAVPAAIVSRSGEMLSSLAGGGYAARLSLAKFATDAVCSLGTNDITAGRTFARLVADYLLGWALLKARGCRVWQVLIIPRTTGANVYNAPLYGPGGIREQINAWFATQVGLGLLDGIIDCNPAVEDPANPGKWLPSMLPADGTHPAEAGHAAMAIEVQKVTRLWTM